MGAQHAADRLLDALNRVGAPVCVGIDPVADRLPDGLGRDLDGIRSFALGVLDAVVPHVACVKLQSACFERYGYRGVETLEQVIGAARQRGLQVILDAKRGDIGISAEHYAEAIFGGDNPPDWVTINSYLGEDGIRPFLKPGVGAFALVRTSNPGGDAVQTARLADGRTVAEHVARLIAEIGADFVGSRGYSALGAVVGATKGPEMQVLRDTMPRQILLVPGFGAQGAGADDVRSCFAANGQGAIVTASRSVVYAFEPGDADWTRSVADAAEALAGQVAGAVA